MESLGVIASPLYVVSFSSALLLCESLQREKCGTLQRVVCLRLRGCFNAFNQLLEPALMLVRAYG